MIIAHRANHSIDVAKAAVRYLRSLGVRVDLKTLVYSSPTTLRFWLADQTPADAYRALEDRIEDTYVKAARKYRVTEDEIVDWTHGVGPDRYKGKPPVPQLVLDWKAGPGWACERNENDVPTLRGACYFDNRKIADRIPGEPGYVRQIRVNPNGKAGLIELSSLPL